MAETWPQIRITDAMRQRVLIEQRIDRILEDLDEGQYWPFWYAVAERQVVQEMADEKGKGDHAI